MLDSNFFASTAQSIAQPHNNNATEYGWIECKGDDFLKLCKEKKQNDENANPNILIHENHFVAETIRRRRESRAKQAKAPRQSLRLERKNAAKAAHAANERARMDRILNDPSQAAQTKELRAEQQRARRTIIRADPDTAAQAKTLHAGQQRARMERKRADPDAAQAKALHARQERERMERKCSIRETEGIALHVLEDKDFFLIIILKLIMQGKWTRYTMQSPPKCAHTNQQQISILCISVFGRNVFTVEFGIGKQNRHPKESTQPVAAKDLSNSFQFNHHLLM